MKEKEEFIDNLLTYVFIVIFITIIALLGFFVWIIVKGLSYFGVI